MPKLRNPTTRLRSGWKFGWSEQAMGLQKQPPLLGGVKGHTHCREGRALWPWPSATCHMRRLVPQRRFPQPRSCLLLGKTVQVILCCGAVLCTGQNSAASLVSPTRHQEHRPHPVSSSDNQNCLQALPHVSLEAPSLSEDCRLPRPLSGVPLGSCDVLC